MKSRTLWTWSLGVGLAALPLIGGCLRPIPGSPEIVAASRQLEPASDPAVPPAAVDTAAAAEEHPASDIADAPVTAVSSDKPLPPNVRPTGPLADLIQLASSGVEEGVMLAFVTNSAGFFNLRADDIIYLNDIGVPGGVVTAMIHRDEELKEWYANAAAAASSASAPPTNPAVPVPYAAAPSPYPAPAEPPTVAPSAPEPEMPPPPPDEVPYPEFYDALSPYGAWVDVAGYGACWQPSVAALNAGWQPYFTGGRWLYTDCGWYWMSSYTWGWAPFHYGRWFHHHQLGWCWRPGAVWGPSWVCWRYTDTHCGWAPLPPGARFTPDIGLKGHEASVARVGPESFRFVPWRNFRDPHLERHVLPDTDAARIYGRTVLSTRIVVTQGKVVNDAIPLTRVASATRAQVPRVALRDVNLPVSAGVRADKLERDGRTLTVYRPHPAAFAGTRTAESLTRGDINARPTRGFPLIIRGPDRAPNAPQIQYPQTAGTSASRGAVSQRMQSQSQSHWLAARDDEWPNRPERQQSFPRLDTPKPSPGSDSRLNPPPFWARPSTPRNADPPGYQLPPNRNAPSDASRNASWAPAHSHFDSLPSRAAEPERSHYDSTPSHAAERSYSAPERSSRSEPAPSHAESSYSASHSGGSSSSSSSSSSSDRGRR